MNIWNFACGYVKICIMGKYPERLLNRASECGIPIKDTVLTEKGFVLCAMPASGLRKLHEIGRGSGCRIRILKRHGLPPVLRNLRFEARILLIAIIVIAAIIAASTRIWLFDIECGGLDRQIFIDALAERGVVRGVSARSFDPSELNAVISDLPGVAASVTVRRGVVLSINVQESDLGYASSGSFGLQTSASGIYALKDCVITSISVISGKALAAEGDAVSQGELLISGDRSDLKEGYSVKAVGEVYGKVLYRAVASVPLSSYELKRSGSKALVIAAELFGKELFVGMPFERYELEPVTEWFLDACPVPLALRKNECFELTKTLVELDEQEAFTRAEELALEQLYASIPKYAKVLTVHTDFIKNNDGIVTASVAATTVEIIGYGRE